MQYLLDNQIKISFHYQLEKDDAHQINAFSHNYSELELLCAITKLIELTGYFNVDVCVPKKGSFIDLLIINGFEISSFGVLTEVLGSFFKNYFTKKEKSLENIERYLRIRDYLKNEYEIGNITKEEIDIIIQHDRRLKKIMRKYFELIDKDIKSINVTASYQNEELFSYTIDSNDFESHFYSTGEDITYQGLELVKNARIIIEIPVFSRVSKRKWSGIYQGDRISFTISDQDFLDEVHQGHIAFNANSTIKCDLEIYYPPLHTSDGNEIKYSKPRYRVTNVIM